MTKDKHCDVPSGFTWKKAGSGFLTALVGGLVVLGGGAIFSTDTPTKTIDTDAIAQAAADKAVTQYADSLNITTVDDSLILTDIKDKLFEDDAWEAEAEIIASEEWERRDNRDIFKAINRYGEYGIDDEDDIIYIREDDSTFFSRMDASEKDGTVTQFLKVKYEDEDGDDRKLYLTIISTIDDGEVDSQEIFKTRFR